MRSHPAVGAVRRADPSLHRPHRSSPRSLTRGGEALYQLWTPDGQRLLFRWLKDGRPSLALKRADATRATPPDVLDGGIGIPGAWLSDKELVVLDRDDLAVLTIEKGHASVQRLPTPGIREAWPDVSPDGHWLTYGSNDSERNEVYVVPYPALSPRTPVSREGGVAPAWNPNGGREVFFLSLEDEAGKRRLMVADFDPGPPVRVGIPRTLFAIPPGLVFFGTPVRFYDVAPDGLRFFAMQTPPATPPPPVTHINLIENWLEELKQKLPSR